MHGQERSLLQALTPNSEVIAGKGWQQHPDEESMKVHHDALSSRHSFDWTPSRQVFCWQKHLECSGICLHIKTGTNCYQTAQPESPQWDIRVSGGKEHDWGPFPGSCNPYCPHYALHQILQLFFSNCTVTESHLPNIVHILIALINFLQFNRTQS